MRIKLDENELSFSVNILGRLLYENLSGFMLDIYYNDRGFPAKIHDAFGAEGVNGSRLALVNRISEYNNTDDVWQVASFAFAIISNPSNCVEFELEYNGEVLSIKKKTIIIQCSDR